VNEPFDVKVELTNLAFSDQLIKISSKELDKSFRIHIDVLPKLTMFFRQDIYNFILRCIDLNFAYTDMLEKFYDFRNTEEYF
jgi:hypothetical protein